MKNIQRVTIFFGLLLALSVLLIPSNNVSAEEGVKHKSAYNRTQNREAAVVTARAGDLIEYTLTFNNTTSYSQNVSIQDDVSSVLQYAEIYNYNGAYISGSVLTFPQTSVASGASLQKTFVVRVKNIPYAVMWMNMSNTYGDTINIQVSASGSGGNTGDVSARSKSAYNQTQAQIAESVYARPGDTITYTLTYRNNASYSQSVAIEDDLTDVLYLADLISYGDATLSGKVLRFPSVSVSSGGRIDRTFQVRVKSISVGAIDYIMSNFYGNGVDIRVSANGEIYKGEVKGAAIPPKTGPGLSFVYLAALLLTAGYFVYNKLKEKKFFGQRV
ncbi:MAG: hypothetical protein AAB871_03705 [Patescibacteria group bacterium]|mgnify:CR=1 FL=1